MKRHRRSFLLFYCCLVSFPHPSHSTSSISRRAVNQHVLLQVEATIEFENVRSASCLSNDNTFREVLREQVEELTVGKGRRQVQWILRVEELFLDRNSDDNDASALIEEHILDVSWNTAVAATAATTSCTASLSAEHSLLLPLQGDDEASLLPSPSSHRITAQQRTLRVAVWERREDGDGGGSLQFCTQHVTHLPRIKTYGEEQKQQNWKPHVFVPLLVRSSWSLPSSSATTQTAWWQFGWYYVRIGLQVWFAVTWILFVYAWKRQRDRQQKRRQQRHVHAPLRPHEEQDDESSSSQVSGDQDFHQQAPPRMERRSVHPYIATGVSFVEAMERLNEQYPPSPNTYYALQQQQQQHRRQQHTRLPPLSPRSLQWLALQQQQPIMPSLPVHQDDDDDGNNSNHESGRYVAEYPHVDSVGPEDNSCAALSATHLDGKGFPCMDPTASTLHTNEHPEAFSPLVQVTTLSAWQQDNAHTGDNHHGKAQEACSNSTMAAVSVNAAFPQVVTHQPQQQQPQHGLCGPILVATAASPDGLPPNDGPINPAELQENSPTALVARTVASVQQLGMEEGATSNDDDNNQNDRVDSPVLHRDVAASDRSQPALSVDDVLSLRQAQQLQNPTRDAVDACVHPVEQQQQNLALESVGSDDTNTSTTALRTVQDNPAALSTSTQPGFDFNPLDNASNENKPANRPVSATDSLGSKNGRPCSQPANEKLPQIHQVKSTSCQVEVLNGKRASTVCPKPVPQQKEEEALHGAIVAVANPDGTFSPPVGPTASAPLSDEDPATTLLSSQSELPSTQDVGKLSEIAEPADDSTARAIHKLGGEKALLPVEKQATARPTEDRSAEGTAAGACCHYSDADAKESAGSASERPRTINTSAGGITEANEKQLDNRSEREATGCGNSIDTFSKDISGELKSAVRGRIDPSIDKGKNRSLDSLSREENTTMAIGAYIGDTSSAIRVSGSADRSISSSLSDIAPMVKQTNTQGTVTTTGDGGSCLEELLAGKVSECETAFGVDVPDGNNVPIHDICNKVTDSNEIARTVASRASDSDVDSMPAATSQADGTPIVETCSVRVLKDCVPPRRIMPTEAGIGSPGSQTKTTNAFQSLDSSIADSKPESTEKTTCEISPLESDLLVGEVDCQGPSITSQKGSSLSEITTHLKNETSQSLSISPQKATVSTTTTPEDASAGRTGGATPFTIHENRGKLEGTVVRTMPSSGMKRDRADLDRPENEKQLLDSPLPKRPCIETRPSTGTEGVATDVDSIMSSSEKGESPKMCQSWPLPHTEDSSSSKDLQPTPALPVEQVSTDAVLSFNTNRQRAATAAVQENAESAQSPVLTSPYISSLEADSERSEDELQDRSSTDELLRFVHSRLEGCRGSVGIMPRDLKDDLLQGEVAPDSQGMAIRGSIETSLGGTNKRADSRQRGSDPTSESPVRKASSCELSFRHIKPRQRISPLAESGAAKQKPANRTQGKEDCEAVVDDILPDFTPSVALLHASQKWKDDAWEFKGAGTRSSPFELDDFQEPNQRKATRRSRKPSRRVSSVAKNAEKKNKRVGRRKPTRVTSKQVTPTDPPKRTTRKRRVSSSTFLQMNDSNKAGKAKQRKGKDCDKSSSLLVRPTTLPSFQGGSDACADRTALAKQNTKCVTSKKSDGKASLTKVATEKQIKPPLSPAHTNILLGSVQGNPSSNSVSMSLRGSGRKGRTSDGLVSTKTPHEHDEFCFPDSQKRGKRRLADDDPFVFDGSSPTASLLFVKP